MNNSTAVPAFLGRTVSCHPVSIPGSAPFVALVISDQDGHSMTALLPAMSATQLGPIIHQAGCSLAEAEKIWAALMDGEE